MAFRCAPLQNRRQWTLRLRTTHAATLGVDDDTPSLSTECLQEELRRSDDAGIPWAPREQLG
eukprot:2597846-Amphidinium_carterae.1